MHVDGHGIRWRARRAARAPDTLFKVPGAHQPCVGLTHSSFSHGVAMTRPSSVTLTLTSSSHLLPRAVILTDPPHHLREMVQCKGRARAPGSQCVMLVEQGCATHGRSFDALRRWVSILGGGRGAGIPEEACPGLP